MLIKEFHVDVSTSTTPMRLFLFHPVLSSGVKARFPAVAVFTEIYQVTAPVSRFCRQIAGRGFIVASCSSYHEFMGPEALAYDDEGSSAVNANSGTKVGNDYKVEKTLEGYDDDAKVTIDYLVGLETCNGRVGATGIPWVRMS
jgi:carboxymethylenebutenolidase